MKRCCQWVEVHRIGYYRWLAPVVPDRQELELRSLIAAYDKNGQQGNAHWLAAKLAALNVPLIEQAVVVPEFRKQRAALAAKTNPALDPRRKYR